MKLRTTTFLLSMIFMLFLTINNLQAQCDFRIDGASENLSFVNIDPLPSAQQQSQISTFLGVSLDVSDAVSGGIVFYAVTQFSPEEVQGVMSILCPGTCIFSDGSSGVGDNRMEIKPSLSSSQISEIMNFLGSDFESSSQESSALTYIEHAASFSAEQIQGVLSLLCGDDCIFEVALGSNDDIVEISPEISQTQLDAIIAALPANFVDNSSLTSSGQSSIGFTMPATASDLAIIRGVLCPAVAPIPTMGEWGILILGLFLVVIGLVAMKDKIRKLALSMFSF